MSTKPIFGYWDIRALGEPIRNMLIYCGVDFVDQKLSDFPKWLAAKFELGLDFPNLPYLIDGDIKITQSIAIMRYLGREYDLYPKDEDSLSRCDMVEQEFDDMRMKFLRLCYFEFDTKKAEYVDEYLPKQIDLVEKFIGHRRWICGDQLTFVDFMVYETLDWLRLFVADLYAERSNIANYMSRFENLPKLEQHFKSDRYYKWPIFAPWAKFGGQGWRHSGST